MARLFVLLTLIASVVFCSLAAAQQFQLPNPPGFVNVKAYGAACDGTTDDTANIRAAVAAAGGATLVAPFTVTSILVIPGKCLVTGTITIRNAAQQNYPFVIQCSGGGAGLFWGGIDNTGPLLTLGDSTFVTQDGPFDVRDCYFNGIVGHKPSIAVYLAMDNNSSFVEGTIGASNALIYAGIKCGNTCLLTKIDHLMFSCLTTCVDLGVNNGSYISNNNFYWCGTWCYHGANEADALLINNYFEGNVSGALGSVYIAGDGDRLIANTFEDQTTAAGSGFLSVEFYVGNSLYFEGNYYVGGCGGGAGCPSYFISLGAGGTTQAEFHGEELGNAVGASGYMIDDVGTGISTWYGGFNCTASQIWSGTQAARQSLVNACGSNYSSGNLDSFKVLNMPTACGSLATGTLWNNSGVVNVCP